MEKSSTVRIQFSVETREEFRTAYDTALAKNLPAFTFAGHEFDTTYASYVLQHLDQQLGPNTEPPDLH